jgi:hypothetical protein
MGSELCKVSTTGGIRYDKRRGACLRDGRAGEVARDRVVGAQGA